MLIHKSHRLQNRERTWLRELRRSDIYIGFHQIRLTSPAPNLLTLPELSSEWLFPPKFRSSRVRNLTDFLLPNSCRSQVGRPPSHNKDVSSTPLLTTSSLAASVAMQYQLPSMIPAGVKGRARSWVQDHHHLGCSQDGFLAACLEVCQVFRLLADLSSDPGRPCRMDSLLQLMEREWSDWKSMWLGPTCESGS